MKKLIKFIVIIALIGFIAYGCYIFFIDINKPIVDFDQTFTLEKYDQARVGNKVTVKLLSIEDNRCKGNDCEREGQYVAKVLVKDDRHVVIEKLGSVGESKKDLSEHKLNYTIELLETDGEKFNFKVINLEEEK